MSSTSPVPLTRLTAPLLVGVAAALALSACAAEPAPEVPVAADPADASDPSELVDDACLEAYPLSALSPADMEMLTLMPADWPAPPDDAVLCATEESGGEEIDGEAYTTQNADYASDTAIEAVLAHYEEALGGEELMRADGTESGTGYATLDGTVGEISFQVRETDGGFTVLFFEGRR